MHNLALDSYDIDLKAFIREDDKVLARLLVESDSLLTNRWGSSPTFGAEGSGGTLDATVRRGLYQTEAGLRLRYESGRRVAPFMAVTRTVYPRALSSGATAETTTRAGIKLLF